MTFKLLNQKIRLKAKIKSKRQMRITRYGSSLSQKTSSASTPFPKAAQMPWMIPYILRSYWFGYQ